MTMEEYFTKKAAAVEDAIIRHCHDICDLIMSQYEEARMKELKQYEQPSGSTKTELTAKLTVISGPHLNQIFVVKPKSKTHPGLGRSTRDIILKNGISLPKDHEVSQYHGEFFIRGGQLKYKDLRSTNNSYVNGEMVEETVTLKTGDILHVGQTDLQIEIIKPN